MLEAALMPMPYRPTALAGNTQDQAKEVMATASLTMSINEANQVYRTAIRPMTSLVSQMAHTLPQKEKPKTAAHG